MSKCSGCGEKKNPPKAKFCPKCGAALGSEAKTVKSGLRTQFPDVVIILSELWTDYRDEEIVQELFAYGDLAFPLAYAISERIVEATLLAEEYIYEVWDLFLGTLGVDDPGLFVSVLELQEASGYRLEKRLVSPLAE